MTGFVVKPCYQALRLHRPYLPGRKVNYSNNELSNEFMGAVEVGDLRTGFFYAQFLAEIDLQDVR